MKILTLVLAAGFAAQDPPKPAAPQVQEQPQPEKKKPVQDPAATAEKAEPAEKKPSPEEKRLQKLIQLQFDRRHATILKALAGGDSKLAPTKKEREKDPVDLELEAFQKAVTLGDWVKVKTYLAGLPGDHGKKAYDQLLKSLGSAGGGGRGNVVVMDAESQGDQNEPDEQVYQMQAAMMARGQMPQGGLFADQNVFMPNDLVGLADASPAALKKDALEQLGRLLQQTPARGNFLESFLKRLEDGTERLGGDDPEKRKAAALLLVSADRIIEAGRFLPAADRVEMDKDVELLNLLARHRMAVHAKEKKKEALEDAWKITQAALTLKEAEAKDQEEALERALEIASQIRKEIGTGWLETSFTSEPRRGMQILATIGRIVSANRLDRNADSRLRKLELQHLAMEALLRVAPERAGEWRRTLDLLALNWLREAEYSRQNDSRQTQDPMMTFDQFGNVFYQDFHDARMMQNRNAFQPIPTGRLLDIRPGAAWLDKLEDSLHPKLVALLAQLHLKVNEPEKGFPYIESLAASHPRDALALANEFLDVWVRNHDPNQERRRTNPYMYIYGYNPRAASIPLTRSKQVRNLEEVAAWVKRLRALRVGDLDERRLSKAFVASHSSAEVYRLEDLEKVFGSVDSLKAETLAELVQTMRGNLAGVWRTPKTQEEKKTNRKDKEIEAEVFRGYEVACQVLARGLKATPDHWALELARASILFDENSFRYQLTRSAEFAGRRAQAFEIFRRAAELYGRKVPEPDHTDETSQVYEMWFYASLGACDLASVTHEQSPDPRQPDLIRRALEALPEAAAERHLARFANQLVTRMTSAKPEVKHRYLRAGLKIAGDHRQARDARKLYDYYNDLVTEIKLTSRVDGPAAVGSARPFGLFVDLRHTKEIDREAGGFQKYLQNQMQNPYAFNFGRPPADYRDKFEEAARAALQEHFEVMSITFHSEKTESRGDPEPGWRVTPYAYVLMKARGPQVDEIPSLRLDLDFLDTTGYVVLPVESPRVPVDASTDRPRPAAKLQVIQTLDERKAAEGKLSVEVKATVRGLVPDLQEILDVAPGEFDVTKVEDQGISIAKMDEESDEISAISERTWVVHLAAKPGLRRPPATVAFGAPKLDGAKMSYQRYVDADLIEVQRVVSLEGRYGGRGAGWAWGAFLLAVAGLGLAGFLFLARRRRTRKKPAEPAYRLPDPLTAFAALGLLKRIRRDSRLKPESAGELAGDIGRIEQYFFNRGEGRPPDLRGIAQHWVGTVAGATDGNGLPEPEAKLSPSK